MRYSACSRSPHGSACLHFHPIQRSFAPQAIVAISQRRFSAGLYTQFCALIAITGTSLTTNSPVPGEVQTYPYPLGLRLVVSVRRNLRLQPPRALERRWRKINQRRWWGMRARW